LLHILVRLAKYRDWLLPSALTITQHLSPSVDLRDPRRRENARRAINRRIERLKDHMRLTGPDSHRRIDPLSLATSSASANYLLVFQRLASIGPVTKELLHDHLLADHSSGHRYTEAQLEAIFSAACDAGYIRPPVPTIPDELGVGQTLHDHLHFLELLSDNDAPIAT
jgi:hypothetical protein